MSMRSLFRSTSRPALAGTLLLCCLMAFLISCVQSSNGKAVFARNTSGIQLKSTDELYQLLTYDEQRFPLISAHRGGPAPGYPENALETFAYQSRQQPLIIECDIRMTSDSILVLMHDETLERTSNGKGKVSNYTYEELKEIRLKDPTGALTAYRIPKLDEALQWGRDKVVFTLDVKRGVPYKLVVDAISRNQAAPYSVVITYSADQALEVYRLDPDLMISASIGSAGALLQLNDRNIPDNRLVAFVGTSEVEKGTYELLHGHGIMCILGTMGNLDRQAERLGDEHYAALIARGADILSTDRPIEAGRALKAYRQQHKLTSKYIQ